MHKKWKGESEGNGEWGVRLLLLQRLHSMFTMMMMVVMITLDAVDF